MADPVAANFCDTSMATPSETDGCEKAELRLFPDGQISYRSGGSVDKGSACLDHYQDEKTSWQVQSPADKAKLSSIVVRLDNSSHSNNKCFQVDAGKTFSFPHLDGSGPIQLTVFASPSSPSDQSSARAQWQPAAEAGSKDPAVQVALATALKTDPTVQTDFDSAVAAFAANGAANYGSTPQPVFRGMVPNPNDDTALIPLEAWSGASVVASRYTDGQTIRLFAFDLDAVTPQDVEVVQGAAIDNSSLLAPLVQAFGLLGVGIKSASAVPVTNAFQLAATAKMKPSARYTSRVVSATIQGGYQYSAEVCQAAASKGADAGPTPPNGSKACAGATQDQISASAAFKVPARHQVVSAVIELGWNFPSGGFPTSAYAYEPISVSGPDQLYQLQKVDKFTDQVTSSALLAFYPFAIWKPTWCANYDPRLFCPVDGFGIAFGPTFLRGSTGELFKQWNLRLMVELATGVLFTFGPSWRAFDVPSGTLDQIVSVPKPAASPTLVTHNEWQPQFSMGLSLDLSLLGNAVSAVANAASGSSSSSTKGAGK